MVLVYDFFRLYDAATVFAASCLWPLEFGFPSIWAMDLSCELLYLLIWGLLFWRRLECWRTWDWDSLGCHMPSCIVQGEQGSMPTLKATKNYNLLTMLWGDPGLFSQYHLLETRISFGVILMVFWHFLHHLLFSLLELKIYIQGLVVGHRMSGRVGS